MDFLIILRAIVSLAFVLSIIASISILAQRFNLFQRLRPGKQMSILESLTLDARNKIILVKVGESTRALLIGHNSCQILADNIELSDIPEEEAKPTLNRESIDWQGALKSIRDRLYTTPIAPPRHPESFARTLNEEIATTEETQEAEAKTA